MAHCVFSLRTLASILAAISVNFALHSAQCSLSFFQLLWLIQSLLKAHLFSLSLLNHLKELLMVSITHIPQIMTHQMETFISNTTIPDSQSYTVMLTIYRHEVNSFQSQQIIQILEKVLLLLDTKGL